MIDSVHSIAQEIKMKSLILNILLLTAVKLSVSNEGE